MASFSSNIKNLLIEAKLVVKISTILPYEINLAVYYVMLVLHIL